jgi:hypothetical protein
MQNAGSNTGVLIINNNQKSFLFCHDPNPVSIYFTDAEVITGNMDGNRISHGGHHLYPNGFAGDASHFHQGKLKITFVMALDNRLGALGQLGKPYRIFFHHFHLHKITANGCTSNREAVK